jgi:RNA polymerase sigma-70 factor (ECF subfamily)
MSTAPSGDVTRLLAAAREGDREAVGRLADLVYDELRQLASHVLRHENPHQTYRTTALVNEAFLRLVGQREISFESRAHFMRTAARAMRSVLVDYARAHRAAKRGGGWARVPMDDLLSSLKRSHIDALALDEALRRLEEVDERKCRVVELRFFAGQSIAQTAEILGVSANTVDRDWEFARLWLYRQLGEAALRP